MELTIDRVSKRFKDKTAVDAVSPRESVRCELWKPVQSRGRQSAGSEPHAGTQSGVRCVRADRAAPREEAGGEARIQPVRGEAEGRAGDHAETDRVEGEPVRAQGGDEGGDRREGDAESVCVVCGTCLLDNWDACWRGQLAFVDVSVGQRRRKGEA